ncbi:LOW QUALITY PROTEIN: TLC domain-containing protein 1 [Narcine bancroftii]|uniref:LOW QUALITY PROTEIN: TLC domain-containing protein 1 n=1 Tax=Narcine bancroftii TaxID=1343680 RepID=UPI00383165EF
MTLFSSLPPAGLRRVQLLPLTHPFPKPCSAPPSRPRRCFTLHGRAGETAGRSDRETRSPPRGLHHSSILPLCNRTCSASPKLSLLNVAFRCRAKETPGEGRRRGDERRDEQRWLVQSVQQRRLEPAPANTICGLVPFCFVPRQRGGGREGGSGECAQPCLMEGGVSSAAAALGGFPGSPASPARQPAMIAQRHPVLSILFFALSFKALRAVLRARSFSLPPQQVKENKTRAWRWTNLNVSLVHSAITGPWALLCVYNAPEMFTEIFAFQNSFSYSLVCVSTGYFIQDVVDIIMNGQSRASWEFLLHHMLVISTFLYIVLTQRYVAGAVISLFVEINSIFLHTRLLLKLANAQSSLLYYYNKYINVFTYVVFRLSSQFYLTWFLMKNVGVLPHAGYIGLSLNMMNVMILVYFYRLIRTDFLSKPKHCLQNGNNNTKFVDD